MRKMDERYYEKISIIIPVYNIHEYIDDMVKSVTYQTYNNIEIILIDDGSSDGSGKICDAWARKDKRVVCVHQKNAGVSAARNKGFAVSTGAYILFADGDDTLAPDMCEKMMKCLKQKDADLSYCGFLNIFDDQTEIMIPKQEVLSDREILYALVADGYFFGAVWNKLFKRETLLDKDGNFITFNSGIRVSEDALWLSKVLKNVRKAVSVPEALYFWRRRANSATRGGVGIRTDKAYLTTLDAYREMTMEMDDQYIKRAMCKRYLGTCRDCLFQAHRERKRELCRELSRRIFRDRYLYRYLDFFIMKLLLCVMLVKLKLPPRLLDKINKIK